MYTASHLSWLHGTPYDFDLAGKLRGQPLPGVQCCCMTTNPPLASCLCFSSGFVQRVMKLNGSDDANCAAIPIRRPRRTFYAVGSDEPRGQ